MRPALDVRDLVLEAVDTRAAKGGLRSAYERIVDAFYRALQETGSYDEAVRRAQAGEPRASVRAYLAGYLTTYLDSPVDRIRGLYDPFLDGYKGGYDQGGADQLSAWGERGERFALRDPLILATIGTAALTMATYATSTADDTLLGQAVASAFRLDSTPDLTAGHLADLNGLMVPYRGYNEGRVDTAVRSVPDEGVMKTWGVLGEALEPREHHQAIEGLTIHLHDLFPIGYGVRWPHDWDFAGAEEWAYCRHFAEYHAPEGATIEPWWGEDVVLP